MRRKTREETDTEEWDVSYTPKNKMAINTSVVSHGTLLGPRDTPSTPV